MYLEGVYFGTLTSKLLPPPTAALCDWCHLFIYLFFNWFASRLTEKVKDGFCLNFQGRLDLAQLRGV